MTIQEDFKQVPHETEAAPHEFGFILTLGTPITIPVTARTKHTFAVGTAGIVMAAGKDRNHLVWYDVAFEGMKTTLRVYANSKHTIQKISWPKQEVPVDGEETAQQ
jgi:hypothetical protein